MSALGSNIKDSDSEEPDKGQPAALPKDKSARKSFAKLRRELNDEESLSPGVQRMLFDEIDRLESDCVEMNSYKSKFHESDKTVAVMNEKFKTKISVEIMHVSCITVGAAALGYGPTVMTLPHGWIVVALGVVLLIAGLLAKAIKL